LGKWPLPTLDQHLYIQNVNMAPETDRESCKDMQIESLTEDGVGSSNSTVEFGYAMNSRVFVGSSFSGIEFPSLTGELQPRTSIQSRLNIAESLLSDLHKASFLVGIFSYDSAPEAGFINVTSPLTIHCEPLPQLPRLIDVSKPLLSTNCEELPIGYWLDHSQLSLPSDLDLWHTNISISVVTFNAIAQGQEDELLRALRDAKRQLHRDIRRLRAALDAMGEEDRRWHAAGRSAAALLEFVSAQSAWFLCHGFHPPDINRPYGNHLPGRSAPALN
jgi:hypothetical protein